MYTNARVVEIIDEKTVLVGCSSSACTSCKAAMFCNNKNDTSFLVRNDNALKLKAGDKVELFMPPARTVASTALVFALPLVVFPLGYLGVKALFNCNELINALGGLGAMAIAFGIAAFISIRNKRLLMPVITRVE